MIFCVCVKGVNGMINQKAKYAKAYIDFIYPKYYRQTANKKTDNALQSHFKMLNFED